MSITPVTLVSTPACHFCADARTALSDLSREFPLEIDLVDADTEHGQALVGEFRPAMFPLVLVDGAFFSAGRLPRRKLRARLAATTITGGRP